MTINHEIINTQINTHNSIMLIAAVKRCSYVTTYEVTGYVLKWCRASFTVNTAPGLSSNPSNNP